MPTADGRVSNKEIEAILRFTAEQGNFGMQAVDRLHETVPPSTCKTSGNCCFSIRMYSIEYHRLILYMAQNFSIEHNREIFRRALNPEGRVVKFGDDVRWKCTLLDAKTQRCSVYEARPFMCRAFGHGFFGQVECPYVKVANPIAPEKFFEASARMGSVSEKFLVPVDDELEEMEAFPFEFWLRRAMTGPGPAIEWYQTTHFYAKYRKSERRI